MTNPFPHGSSGFGDTFSSSNPPNPLGQRRPSYASVVSGPPTHAARPARAGAFSHLLNPTTSDDAGHASGVYYASNRIPSLRWQPPSQATHPDHAAGPASQADAARGLRLGEQPLPASMERNGRGAAADAPRGPSSSTVTNPWGPPPYGTGLPLFSRVFDMYMTRDAQELGGDKGALGPGVSSTGVLSPSYLRGSVYLQKLEVAHRAKLAALREGHKAAAAGMAHQQQYQHGAHHRYPFPIGSSTGMGVHVTGRKLPSGSYRGVSYELVEKPPANLEEDEGVSPLPSRWNQEDVAPGLEVLGDGLEIKHTGLKGASEREQEACAVRTDHFMPPQCGVYYFEVTVLNRRKEDTQIGIGFSSKSVSLVRAPGWEPDSWGYHGDDGNIFAAQNSGKPYGPKFGANDTIGCLVNFRLGHAMFTKNGHELGVAFRDVNFKDVKGTLFPSIGLKRPGDHLRANFGQTPFIFDIDGYMKKQKSMVFDNISGADASKLAPPLTETELIQQLVLQFLQHDGYVETARAFAEDVRAEKEALNLERREIEEINIKDDEDANNRQGIRKAILDGDIDRALKSTEAYYPRVLRDNEPIYLRLRCRKFVEMIRKDAEYNLLREKKGLGHVAGHASNNSLKSAVHPRYEDDEEMTEADDDGLDEAMDESSEDDGMMAYGGDAASSGGVSKLSQDALIYGQELRSEFSADPRREVSKHLDEIFALIAYPNPLKIKEVAHLLDKSGRLALAEELNSVILQSVGKSSRAALEKVYAQTAVLLEDLRQDGGDGAFITLQSIVDDIPAPGL